jgi:hypothetical protein
LWYLTFIIFILAKNAIKEITNKMWKEKIKKTIFWCIRTCNKDPEILVKNINMYEKHFSGDHSTCIGCSKINHLDFNKKNHLKIYEKIKKSFKKIADNSEKYCNGYSSSLVESINRAILVSASKEKGFNKTYCGRVDSCFNRLTLGELWCKNIFKDLKIPLCKGTINYMKKKDNEYYKNFEMRRSDVEKKKKTSEKIKKNYIKRTKK